MKQKKLITLTYIVAVIILMLISSVLIIQKKQAEPYILASATIQKEERFSQLAENQEENKDIKTIEKSEELEYHVEADLVEEIGDITEVIVEEVIEESNMVIATVNNYVNIRSLPSEDGEIVGKLYDKSIGTLMDVADDWYLIESGNVIGYVKSEYVLTGDAAQELADQVGVRIATVTTQTLRVRSEANVESSIIGLVPEGDVLLVEEEVDGFVKVSVEDGEGFVSTEFVELHTENVVAESIEEEQKRLQKEAEERKRAEEAARKAIAAKQPATTQASTTITTAPEGDTALGQQIVDFAVKHVGNPYVYGGTSLTEGADCSGFVQSVFSNFGISLPRTSGEQGKSGSYVDGVANAQPGDLVWYSGHIGIYMGNNQVVHASNEREGIKISTVTYRKILGIRRIV